jgi:glutathione S-transferase
MKLYDAPACPYCARVRLALAEKGCLYETVAVNLRDRPAWLFELDAPGRVPVLEDGFILPESVAIMEYLEERFPEPPLLPDDLAGRARVRLAVVRFDELLGRDYYALRGGRPNDVETRIAELPLGLGLLSDFAFLPWVIRLRERLGVTLPAAVEAWLGTLLERPAVAAELELVAGLT